MKCINKKKKYILFALFLAVFVCMFVFFYCMHPIVILDSDDWQYVSYARPAVPYTGFWNPARIFPEVLMPFCGTVASVIFHLGFLGYIESQTFVFAVTLSLFIAAYVHAFAVFFTKKFSLSSWAVVLLSAFFLLMHFLIFRTAKSDNLYMFWSYDASCYFYYTIPSIACCSLVLYFESSSILDNFFSKDNLFKKSLVVVAVYFCIFSNLFNSIILAVYMAYKVLSTRKILSMHSLIVVLFGISMIFEAFGQRGSVSIDNPVDIKGAFSNLISVFSSFSIFFNLIMLGIIAFAFVLFFFFKRKNKYLSAELKPHLFSFFIIAVFEILLCGKVNALYMLRPQVFFGMGFAIFMMICICFAYILKELPNIVVLMPFALIVMVSIINTQDVTFAESNTMNLPYSTCLSINNDIISQVIEADRNGLEEMTLDVMDTGYDDNWPHSDFVGFGIGQSLYKHGVVNNDIKINVHWSLDFNERNGLNITEFSQDRY